MKFVERMFSGPVDVVGDVHGEAAALERLLARLGYSEDGTHPDGRRLVFVGDLTDRGPDSPAVLRRVEALVRAGRAQCVLGNHELNLLRDVPKHGNDWWTRPRQPTEHPQRTVTAFDKLHFMRFLRTLPLALERPDLRVVHACWHQEAIATVRRVRDAGALALYRRQARALVTRWAAPARREQLQAELGTVDLQDMSVEPPFLPLHARRDSEHQCENAVTVLTSGRERETRQPFWAGGRWRMVERLKWWNHYEDAVPVVIGHFWRRFDSRDTALAGKYGPDLFAGHGPDEWLGARRNVYCIDFSVGARPSQRAAGQPEDIVQLSALRVPEWQVVHDLAVPWQLSRPGRY